MKMGSHKTPEAGTCTSAAGQVTSAKACLVTTPQTGQEMLTVTTTPICGSGVMTVAPPLQAVSSAPRTTLRTTHAQHHVTHASIFSQSLTMPEGIEWKSPSIVAVISIHSHLWPPEQRYQQPARHRSQSPPPEQRYQQTARHRSQSSSRTSAGATRRCPPPTRRRPTIPQRTCFAARSRRCH